MTTERMLEFLELQEVATVSGVHWNVGRIVLPLPASAAFLAYAAGSWFRAVETGRGSARDQGR